jgi:hypothetical protein
VRPWTTCCALLVAAAGLASAAGAGPGGLAPPPSAHVPRWHAWLCRPGIARNYCDVYLTTTLVGFGGHRTVEDPQPDRKTPIDCFYVYPTVSQERRGNADLRIQDDEIAVVVAQASRVRQVCRVFAPVYRQTTSYSHEFHGDSALAYRDVLAAWKDYLAHWNHGRGGVEFPQLYTARCVRRGSRAWLLVTSSRRPGDGRPLVREILAPGWGLHASDVNVELGGLVDLVRTQGRAWAARH